MAGRFATRVVTTTGDVVDAPDLETLDWEKKLRSEDDLALGDDNIITRRRLQIQTTNLEKYSPKSREYSTASSTTYGSMYWKGVILQHAESMQNPLQYN